MTVEEPEDADADGLKVAMENSFKKLEIEVDRKENEIGLCSDGAAVNHSLFEKVKAEMGDHYVKVWCPSHRIELAVRDAFKENEFNNVCEKDQSNIYYLFKRAPLRWRLFKRQAIFMGIKYWKYKRPSGTRWTEHQVANINSNLHNLPILIGFLNQQISMPHNASIKKIKSDLEGYKASICNVDRIIYAAAKKDVLAIIQPLTKIMQENSIILPSVISSCANTLKTFKKLNERVIAEESNILGDTNIFPTSARYNVFISYVFIYHSVNSNS